MEEVTVRNLSRPLLSPLEAGYCNSFVCRLRGLTFKRNLPPNWGLLLVQDREGRLDASIHMLWMWIDLAIIWVNSKMRVVDVRPAYRWRSFIIPVRPAKFVLEIAIDRLDDFQIGDEISFNGENFE